MRRGDQTGLRRIGGAESGSAPLLDVVFVHGLGGDGIATWTPEGATESWLDWLGQDIPAIAVWSLTYPAGTTRWTAEGEGMALPDRADNLIDNTLLYYGIGTRPIVFVCHSLGGLVVKQILHHAVGKNVSRWKPIARSTLGVAFLATPHAGSNLATFLKAVSVSRPTRTALALTAHCPHLKELADWYRQNVGDLGIETAAYAESRKVKRGIHSITVVTTTSADPGIEGCITTSIDADHFDICKPVSRDTDIYRGIESFIRRQLARLQPSTDVAASENSDTRLLDQSLVDTLKVGIDRRYYGVGRQTAGERMSMQMNRIRGAAMMGTGLLEEAAATLNDALESAGHVGLSETTDALTVRAVLATVYTELGQFSQALELQSDSSTSSKLSMGRTIR